MLPNESVSHFPAPPPTWSDVVRLCRRVCILRERGLHADAEKLLVESLPPLLATVRAPQETDAALNLRLDAVFAQETERVANAAVLAELLRPLLAEDLPAATALPVGTPAPVLVPLATAPAVTPPAAPPPKPPTRGAISIADFIDDMIAQESPPDRAGDSARRRAS